MKSISDNDLDYIRKHLNVDSPEKIAEHLKISVKEYYLARQGLIGIKPPNLFIINRNLFQKIYSHILVLFIAFLLLSNLIIHDGKGMEQIKFILPIALFLLSIFFLKFIFFKITSIEQSPLDLLFIVTQCVLFILSQFFKSEVAFFALALIFLLGTIIYYLTLNAMQEKDLHFLLKFIPFATLFLAIITNYFETLLISGKLIQFLCLISLPLLICFFIYAQKSLIVHLYGFMIGAILGVHYLNFNSSFNNLVLAIVLLIYLGGIFFLKFTLKNKIILNRLFYFGLLIIPFGFLLISNLFSKSLFLNYHSFPNSSSILDNLYNFANLHLETYPTIILVITIIVYGFLLKFSSDIIRDADCFSEKIFASLAFPIIIAIYLTISKIRLWEEVCFYLVFIALLSSIIAKQYYFKMQENGKSFVKVKKKTELNWPISLILSILIFAGTTWFILLMCFTKNKDL